MEPINENYNENINDNSQSIAMSEEETFTSKVENGIGWKITVFFLIAMGGQVLIATIMKAVSPDFYNLVTSKYSFALPLITVDVIAFPVFYFLTRKNPNGEKEHLKMGVGSILKAICVVYFLMIVGAIIGAVINAAFVGQVSNPVGDMISSNDPVTRILYAAIIGPIFEELVFRKILIDKLSVRGKVFALVVSSVFFGLMHGNLAQFFYATFVGFLWGYIYLKTSNIIYSMILHIFMNSMTTLLAVKFIAMYDPSDVMSAVPLGLYLMGMFILGFIGLIFFIVGFKKIRIEENENATVKGGKVFGSIFKSWGLWLFIVCTIGFMIYQTWILKENAKPAITAFNIETTLEGNADSADEKIDFRVGKSGNYVFKADYYDNEEPGFILGISVETEDGKLMNWFTGSIASVEMIPMYYDEGMYSIKIEYLANEQEFIDYCHNMNERSDIKIDEITECNFRGFDKETYSINMKMSLVQSK